MRTMREFDCEGMLFRGHLCAAGKEHRIYSKLEDSKGLVPFVARLLEHGGGSVTSKGRVFRIDALKVNMQWWCELHVVEIMS